MASAACCKKLLFICNFIFWIGGITVLGFGVWMQIDPTIVHYLQVVNLQGSDPLLHYAGFVFIAVGALALIAGFMGCCGALRESQGLLFVYAVCLVIVMSGELAGGALALVYRSKVEASLADSMTTQIKTEYETGSPVMSAWDALQQLHKCCGSKSFEDYRDSAWWDTSRVHVNGTSILEQVPASCCVPDGYVMCQRDADLGNMGSADLYTQGCYDAVELWIKQHSLVMTILGLAIGGVQVFGLITACCLRKALKAAHI